MRHFRGYRGMRRQSIRNPGITFKKVINEASASELSGKIDFIIASGVDGISPTQATAVDHTVPVGGIISKFNIWINYASLANVAVFVTWSIQLLHKSQSSIDPLLVGGDDQRNQVMLMGVKSVGLNQNSDIQIKFNVPKKFQRIRAGDFWVVTTNATNVSTAQKMCIYTFKT